MKKLFASITVIMILILTVTAFALPISAAGAENASDQTAVAEVLLEPAEESASDTDGIKAISAAVTIGVTGIAAVFSMGWAICKAVEGIARQPAADGKIRTSLMLGLVFIETVIIYSLITVILIIFVL